MSDEPSARDRGRTGLPRSWDGDIFLGVQVHGEWRRCGDTWFFIEQGLRADRTRVDMLVEFNA